MIMIFKTNIKLFSYLNFNRILKSSSIHLESSFTKQYNTKSIPKIKTRFIDDDSNHSRSNKQNEFFNYKHGSFEQEIKFRHNQAKRSLLFKLENKFTNKREQLQCLLDDFKSMKCLVQEALLVGSSNNASILIEFKTLNCVNKILEKHCKTFKNVDGLPTTTRLLFYTPKMRQKHIIDRLAVSDFTDLNLKEYDYESLEKINDINDQIQAFYDLNKIDDLGYRLRYFVGAIMEESIGGIFQNCLCLPFGSSMNKFGAKIADLDLSCSLNGNKSLKAFNLDDYSLNGSFYFLSNQKEEKRHKRKNFNVFELIEIIISNLVPRFKFIQAIPHARVPIIKFEAQIGHALSCDLSLSNVEVSYLMTKLFWSYSKLDDRVAPLVFLIRHWASLTGVKNQTSPSPSLTSFQLTCLVLYYLNNMEKPLIVAIDDLLDKKQYSNLLKYERYQDNSIELDEIISNLTINDNLPFKESKNTTNLIDLFDGFFKFYSNFNFNKNVIALSREPLNKPVNNNKIFIENPFMPSLNASQNVSPAKLAYFQDTCRLTNALIQKSKVNLNLNTFFSDIQSMKNAISAKKVDRTVFDDMNL